MSKKLFTHHFYGIKGGGVQASKFGEADFDKWVKGKVRTRPDIFGGPEDYHD